MKFCSRGSRRTSVERVCGLLHLKARLSYLGIDPSFFPFSEKEASWPRCFFSSSRQGGGYQRERAQGVGLSVYLYLSIVSYRTRLSEELFVMKGNTRKRRRRHLEKRA